MSLEFLHFFVYGKVQRRQARLKIAQHVPRRPAPRVSAGYKYRQQKIESRPGRLKLVVGLQGPNHLKTLRI